MKATIKGCTAARQFNEDQKQILRRVTMVLIEHDLSAAVTIKVKKTKRLKLKAV